MKVPMMQCVHERKQEKGTVTEIGFLGDDHQGQQQLRHGAGLSLGDTLHVPWQAHWSQQDCKSQKPDSELDSVGGTSVLL